MLGSGILKGLAVTAKNLVGSYTTPERMVTVEYPEERIPLPEAYRNFPFLVSESAEDPMGTLRCVACQICEKECPPQCIYIEKSRDKKPDATGKLQLYPAIFDIDISVCMSCQICVEVCPFDAIKMDQVFEIAESERFSALLLRREQLAKPNHYYHEIHPTEAAEVDARLAAERQATAAKKVAAGVPVPTNRATLPSAASTLTTTPHPAVTSPGSSLSAQPADAPRADAFKPPPAA